MLFRTLEFTVNSIFTKCVHSPATGSFQHNAFDLIQQIKLKSFKSSEHLFFKVKTFNSKMLLEPLAKNLTALRAAYERVTGELFQ